MGSGLGTVLEEAAGLKSEAAIAEFFRTTFLTFLKENISFLTLYGLLVILVAFIILAWARSVRLGMMKDLVTKKKPSLMHSMEYVKLYFWRLVGLQILIMILWLALIFVGLIVAGLVANSTFLLINVAILFVLLSLILYLSLFFSKQILVLDNKGIIDSMKLSIQLFKKRWKFVVKVFLILLVTFFLINVLINIISKVFPTLSNLIGAFMWLVVGLWMILFTFRMYQVRTKY